MLVLQSRKITVKITSLSIAIVIGSDITRYMLVCPLPVTNVHTQPALCMQTPSIVLVLVFDFMTVISMEEKIKEK